MAAVSNKLKHDPKSTWLLTMAIVSELAAVGLATWAGGFLAQHYECSQIVTGQFVAWALSVVGIVLGTVGAYLAFVSGHMNFKRLAIAIVGLCFILSVLTWLLSVFCMSY